MEIGEADREEAGHVVGVGAVQIFGFDLLRVGEPALGDVADPAHRGHAEEGIARRRVAALAEGEADRGRVRLRLPFDQALARRADLRRDRDPQDGAIDAKARGALAVQHPGADEFSAAHRRRGLDVALERRGDPGLARMIGDLVGALVEGDLIDRRVDRCEVLREGRGVGQATLSVEQAIDPGVGEEPHPRQRFFRW